MMAAPSAASRSAMPAPMPLDAPVTTATLSWREVIGSCLFEMKAASTTRHGSQVRRIDQAQKWGSAHFGLKLRFIISCMSPDLLPAIASFARVAHHGSFTRAAAELG